MSSNMWCFASRYNDNLNYLTTFIHNSDLVNYKTVIQGGYVYKNGWIISL